MDQLDYFREQLNKKPVEDSPVSQPQDAVKGKRRGRRKKDEKEMNLQGSSCIKLSSESLRKARLLSVWLDANGIQQRASLNGLFEEALNLMINSKYPKFRAALRGFQETEIE